MVVAFFVATFVSCASSKTVDEIPQEDVWTPVSDLSDLTGTFVGEIQIKAVGDDMQQLICDALDAMDMENAELATLYYGEGVTEADANALLEQLEEQYPDVEFELYLGAQAVYSYLISVE